MVLLPRSVRSLMVLSTVLMWSNCDTPEEPGGCDVATLTVEPGEVVSLSAIGATVRLTATVTDVCGETTTAANVNWESLEPRVARVEGGLVTALAEGVAYVKASRGGEEQLVGVAVSVSRTGPLSSAGVGVAPRRTTEVWAHGGYAYSGTIAAVCGAEGTPSCETITNPIYIWRLAANGIPQLVDSVVVLAFSIGDLQVSDDGRYLFAGIQGGNPALQIYDLANPAAPALVTTFTQGIPNGVHTLDLARIGGRDYAFLAPSASNIPMVIVDVTDPRAPEAVGSFYGGSSNIHDMDVRDGLAFLAHWHAGLVILDVGNGIRGGSPANPVVVSRLPADMRALHNATYWPERRLLFLGEERADGRLIVVNVADPINPQVVGQTVLTGGSPHNFWLDEDNGILLAAWYLNGLRAFDVSGDVTGDWHTGGRIIGAHAPVGPHGPSSFWGPMIANGRIYASDTENGVWAFNYTP